MVNKEVNLILDEVDKLMEEIADKCFELTQNNLVDDGKIDTGALLQTANINKEYLYKQIVYPAEYAEVVNYGRTAGATPPPVAPILKWVKRKLGVTNDKEAQSLAFAICKSISQRGIMPTFFIERAVDEVTNEYSQTSI